MAPVVFSSAAYARAQYIIRCQAIWLNGSDSSEDARSARIRTGNKFAPWFPFDVSGIDTFHYKYTTCGPLAVPNVLGRSWSGVPIAPWGDLLQRGCLQMLVSLGCAALATGIWLAIGGIPLSSPRRSNALSWSAAAHVMASSMIAALSVWFVAIVDWYLRQPLGVQWLPVVSIHQDWPPSESQATYVLSVIPISLAAPVVLKQRLLRSGRKELGLCAECGYPAHPNPFAVCTECGCTPRKCCNFAKHASVIFDLSLIALAVFVGWLVIGDWLKIGDGPARGDEWRTTCRLRLIDTNLPTFDAVFCWPGDVVEIDINDNRWLLVAYPSYDDVSPGRVAWAAMQIGDVGKEPMRTRGSVSATDALAGGVFGPSGEPGVKFQIQGHWFYLPNTNWASDNNRGLPGRIEYPPGDSNVVFVRRHRAPFHMLADGLVDQLRRDAISIPTNAVEAFP